jgi:hypothetical protein
MAMEITPKLEKALKGSRADHCHTTEAPIAGPWGESSRHEQRGNSFVVSALQLRSLKRQLQKRCFQVCNKPFGCLVANCDAWFDQSE